MVCIVFFTVCMYNNITGYFLDLSQDFLVFLILRDFLLFFVLYVVVLRLPPTNLDAYPHGYLFEPLSSGVGNTVVIR